MRVGRRDVHLEGVGKGDGDLGVGEIGTPEGSGRRVWTWYGWGGRYGLGKPRRGDVNPGGLKSSLGVGVVGIFVV